MFLSQNMGSYFKWGYSIHSVSWRDITSLGARLIKVEHEVHATLLALVLSLTAPLGEACLGVFFIFIVYGHCEILYNRSFVLGHGLDMLLLYLILHFDDWSSKRLSSFKLQLWHSLLITFMLELITIVWTHLLLQVWGGVWLGRQFLHKFVVVTWLLLLFLSIFH